MAGPQSCFWSFGTSVALRSQFGLHCGEVAVIARSVCVHVPMHWGFGLLLSCSLETPCSQYGCCTLTSMVCITCVSRCWRGKMQTSITRPRVSTPFFQPAKQTCGRRALSIRAAALKLPNAISKVGGGSEVVAHAIASANASTLGHFLQTGLSDFGVLLLVWHRWLPRATWSWLRWQSWRKRRLAASCSPPRRSGGQPQVGDGCVLCSVLRGILFKAWL